MDNQRDSDTPESQQPAGDQRQALRLWPGIVVAVLVLVLRFVVPALVPEMMPYSVMATLATVLLVPIWWVFFSRATSTERWGGLVLTVASLFVAKQFIHSTIAGGMMGMMYFIYALPIMSIVFVAWAVLFRNLGVGPRRLSMAVTILLSCGFWTLLRTSGMDASATNDFSWRWSDTEEQRLLANEQALVTDVTPVDLAEKEAQWSGFRGADRDGIVHGTSIDTDWAASPPKELWRRPIGPGWSSFAVLGDRFFTQEQRGEEEVVACYRLASGEPIWRHADTTRFWESIGGAGPRATPTISGGRIYTLGATGILNVLDAADGSVIWTRNAATDLNAKTPIWGFSGSPLVVGDQVLAALSGFLGSYDLASGELRWQGTDGGEGYGSPHLLTIDGVDQILLRGGSNLSSYSLDGSLLWKNDWNGSGILQPAQTPAGDVIYGDGDGTRSLAVTQGAEGWSATERWTTNLLKPYFSDYAVHNGHVYGFNGHFLACLNTADGTRMWKGGRYGQGQLILLADQNLLLVLSEKGELALVSATPDGYSELNRIPAVAGKTWNHPVLVGDTLLVRNDREMVAFQLAQKGY